MSILSPEILTLLTFVRIGGLAVSAPVLVALVTLFAIKHLAEAIGSRR